MAVLPIYVYDQAVLKRKAKPVQKVDETLVKLVDDMFETMRKANGIGLAANQVGSLQRVVTIDVSGMEGMEAAKPLALLNPRIIDEEGEVTMEEGCLSLPDLREDDIERLRMVVRELSALPALDAALSDEWEMVPLVKVGFDLAERAREFVRGLDRVARDAAPIEVPHLNNRVTLHYQSTERRCERLTGGVPGWSWLGLKPLLADLDAGEDVHAAAHAGSRAPCHQAIARAEPAAAAAGPLPRR